MEETGLVASILELGETDLMSSDSLRGRQRFHRSGVWRMHHGFLSNCTVCTALAPRRPC